MMELKRCFSSSMDRRKSSSKESEKVTSSMRKGLFVELVSLVESIGLI